MSVREWEKVQEVLRTLTGLCRDWLLKPFVPFIFLGFLAEGVKNAIVTAEALRRGEILSWFMDLCASAPLR